MKKIASFISGSFLCVAVFLTSWALLRPGMFKIHDFVHGARIVEMATALTDGHIPVRWSANFGFGYGMPLFEFYAPLPYVTGAFLYLLGLPLVLSVKLLFLFATVGMVVGGYFFGKTLFTSRWTGVVTAFVLAFAPYRALNLFVRGAISEAWAMMALPWILYGFLLLSSSRKRGFVVLLFSFVVLFLSHNLTTLIAIPFLLAFFASYLATQFSMNKKRKEVVSQLVTGSASLVLALGVAAFYVVPAFLEKDFTQIHEAIVSEYFNYKLHFLYVRQFVQPYWGYGGSEWGPNDPISFFLGFGQWFGMLVCGGIVVQSLVLSLKKRKVALLFALNQLGIVASAALLFSGALFMTLQRAEAVWAVVPVLEYIQFPWRFLSVSSVFASVIVAAPMVWLRQRKLQASYFFVVLGLLTIGNTLYFKPEGFLDDPKGLYYSDPERIQKEMSGILPDYIPKGLLAADASAVPQDALKCQPECKSKNELVRRTHERLYGVELTSATKLEFAIAYFPGWLVEVDGKNWDFEVSPEGTLSVLLEPGTYQVGARFGTTTVRSVADVITGISLVVCLYLLVWFEQRKQKARLRQKYD